MNADCRAFCSTANLGAGFDVFGLALRKYSDIVSVKTTTSRKIRVLPETNWSQALPRDPNQNSAGPPAKALLRMSNFKGGLEIRIRKGVPYGLGLGSSGATAAACTKCVDHLLRIDLSNDELVRAASLGEKAVSGAAHADNVAASTLGGFTIVYDNPVRTISLRPPTELVIVVVTPKLPQHQGKTRLARRLIPQTLRVREAVLNIGRASAIVSGFANKNIERIGTAMHDEIAEPYREQTIPGINQARNAALQAGAAGVAISGAGPSIIAIVDKSREDPRGVAKAMVYGFRQAKIESRSFTTEPGPAARILER